MGRNQTDRADDERLLRWLDLHDNEGMTRSEIADASEASRSAVVGAIYRVNKAADAVACKCRRKTNCDGGMPRKWWAKGDG